MTAKNKPAVGGVFPCIYCRRVSVPRTIEHVLQHALGATSTLPTEVCGGAPEPGEAMRCNNAFSRLDTVFVNFVQTFYGGQIMNLVGRGHGLNEDPESGLLLAARIVRGLLVYRPQLFRQKDGTWACYHAPDFDIRAFQAELAAPSTLNLRTKVVAADNGEVGLAIIRSKARTYLIQGPSQESVASLEADIKSRKFASLVALNSRRDERSDRPNPVQYRSPIDYSAFARASAKIALNFVCRHFGPEVALNSAFDPIRRMARYNEGNWHDFVTPALLTHDLTTMGRGYSAPDRHAIVLQQLPMAGGFQIMALILISGHLVAKVLLLPAAVDAPPLPLGTWRVSYFYPKSRKVEDFVIPADGFKCFANPAAVGIEVAVESESPPSALTAG